MKLEVDAGNSWVKWRITEGDCEIVRGSQLTQPLREGQAFDLEAAGLQILDSLGEASISSVAGEEVVAAVQDMLLNRCGLQASVAIVTPKAAGVTCAYQNTINLGIDRWLAILASFNQFGASVVIDAGSAITIDVVDGSGCHLGGYILPGLHLMKRALWKGTDQVQVSQAWQSEIFPPGEDTGDAVIKGCLLMAVSAIERVLQECEGQAVITGGDATLIIPHIGVDLIHAPDLVLEGLSFGEVVRNDA